MGKFFGCFSFHIEIIQPVQSCQAGDVMKYSTQADAVVIYVERDLLSRSTIGYEDIHFLFDLTRADVIQLESPTMWSDAAFVLVSLFLSPAVVNVEMNEYK